MRVIWQGTPEEMADLIKAMIMIGQPKETEEFAKDLVKGWKSSICDTVPGEIAEDKERP
ncbi:MAG: hypothetical protein IJJ07_00100 [Lachnospiraceae bacterium]|nr:hypothetical protein [Lachnospiraceae bacterium]